MRMPHVTLLRLAAVAACLGLCLAAPGAAQTGIVLGGIEADPQAPVEITSDSLTVDQQSGTAVFTGNVVIGQGELRLAAARVRVVYGEAAGEIARLEASGGVTFVTATEAAEAQEAVYDLQAGRLVLTGEVLLTQGQSALSAERMVVDLEAGTAQMEGRVRTVLPQDGG